MNENDEGSLRRKNANSSTLMTTNFSGKTKNSIIVGGEGEKAVTNTTTTKKSLNVVEEENKDEQLSKSNNNSSNSSAFKSFIVDAQNSFKNLTSFQEMKNNWSDYVQKTHDAQMKLLEENALKFSKDLNKMGLKVHFMPEVMKTRTEMEFRGLRKAEREAMKRFCFHTAKLVRREIQLKEAEKERRKAMEEERLTDEIVGRVNALKRKVEKEEKLRAEADEAFASAYAKLREREQFIENNTFVSNALAEKLLGPGNVASGNGSDLRDKNGTSPPKKNAMMSGRNSPTDQAAVAENSKKELHRRKEEASEASTSDVLSDAHTNDDDDDDDETVKESGHIRKGNNACDEDDEDEDGTSSVVTRSILTALLQKRHLTEDKNPQEIIKLERELHQIRCVVALQRIYRREKHLKTIRMKQKRERDAKVRKGLITLFVFVCAYFGVKFVGLVLAIIRNVHRRVFVMEPYDRSIVYAGKDASYQPPWYVTAGIVDLAPLTHARYSIAMDELDQLAASEKKKKMKMKSDDDDDDDNDDITSSSSSSALIGSVELARLRAKYEKNLEVQKLSFQSEIEQRQCKRGKASKSAGEDVRETTSKLIEISQRALERSLSRARQRELAALARLDQKTKQFEKEKETLLSGQGGFAAKFARRFWTTSVFLLLFLSAWSLQQRETNTTRNRVYRSIKSKSNAVLSAVFASKLFTSSSES
ncbi:unnamed protein product [Bathycoccus prasinos]|jgi:hypothetical protein